MIMTTAVAEDPHGIIFGMQCLNGPNAIFELQTHVVIGPIAFLASTITILEADSDLFSIQNLFIVPDQQGAKTFQSQTLVFGKRRSLSHFLHP
jgi:hypothetical protein